MRNKLNAYVRIDGSGRTVAGSTVYRVNMPKNGKWLQIQDDECCTTTTTTTLAP